MGLPALCFALTGKTCEQSYRMVCLQHPGRSLLQPAKALTNSSPVHSQGERDLLIIYRWRKRKKLFGVFSFSFLALFRKLKYMSIFLSVERIPGKLKTGIKAVMVFKQRMGCSLRKESLIHSDSSETCWNTME